MAVADDSIPMQMDCADYECEESVAQMLLLEWARTLVIL